MSDFPELPPFLLEHREQFHEVIVASPAEKDFTFDIDSPLIVLTTVIASEQFNGRCLCVVNKQHSIFSMVEMKVETNLEGVERLRSISRLMESWNPK